MNPINKKMKIKSIASYFLTAALLTGACTDLDETELLYDQVTQENFYKTDLEYLSAVGAAYSNLFGSFGSADNIMPLQEVTTDEMVVPTRGPDWGDGGNWVRLQTHTYNSQDPRPATSWAKLYSGVNNCNRLLAILEPVGTAK